MKDIGFGVIDRHTVITTLFSMVLAQILFNFQIPVDTTSVDRLFVDLILLTGYLYLSRSIYRLPISLVVSLTQTIFWLLGSIQLAWEEIQQKPTLKRFGLGVVVLVFFPLLSVLLLIVRTLSFGQWVEDEGLPWRLGIFNSRLSRFFFGMLDRTGVVLIAVLATVPSLRSDVEKIGVVGAILMVIVFTIRGDFSALVRDILEREKHEERS